MGSTEEAKLQRFLDWLHVNKVELRGCSIEYCGPNKGFGLFSSNDVSDGVLLVVPLDLAITPMRVLQDPFIGQECRAMFEEGEVDDRFLIILFLLVERLRKCSSWKPYIDMLPTTFGNPLWFTDDELMELKGTTLHRATILQKKSLQSLYDDKVRHLLKKLLTLDGDSESEVTFEDFLWANSVFWTRALNIPLPHSYVFPQVQDNQDNQCSNNKDSLVSNNDISSKERINEKNEERSKGDGIDGQANGMSPISTQGETVWVEGLVPGIDFCNHNLKALATWEVDGNGLITGVPSSMYLLSAEGASFKNQQEIFISYGNKGNEELLYLYGFVIDNNPDDYLMLHYPVEAIQNDPYSDSKMQLLEAQKAELRYLLPRKLLDNGFFAHGASSNDTNFKHEGNRVSSFSWSGKRKVPSYADKLVFPEDLLAALRIIAIREEELYAVASLLQELIGSDGVRIPTETETRAAVWEACGDSGALQLLVDLLQTKVIDLEEGSGTEDHDTELLENAQNFEHLQLQNRETNESIRPESISRNRWASIVYRRGQKLLTRLFFKEAEHALQLALSEDS